MSEPREELKKLSREVADQLNETCCPDCEFFDEEEWEEVDEEKKESDVVNIKK